jgi:hypothetical protein
MENGMMPASAVDTLLSFGYMMSGVVNVGLEISQEDKKVKYDITLKASYHRKYKLINKLSKGGVFSKVAAIFLIQILRAPKPFIYENFVSISAKAYLPFNYEVEVNVRR